MKLPSPLDLVDPNKRGAGDHEILILALVGGKPLMTADVGRTGSADWGKWLAGVTWQVAATIGKSAKVPTEVAHAHLIEAMNAQLELGNEELELTILRN